MSKSARWGLVVERRTLLILAAVLAAGISLGVALRFVDSTRSYRIRRAACAHRVRSRDRRRGSWGSPPGDARGPYPPAGIRRHSSAVCSSGIRSGRPGSPAPPSGEAYSMTVPDPPGLTIEGSLSCEWPPGRRRVASFSANEPATVDEQRITLRVSFTAPEPALARTTADGRPLAPYRSRASDVLEPRIGDPLLGVPGQTTGRRRRPSGASQHRGRDRRGERTGGRLERLGKSDPRIRGFPRLRARVVLRATALTPAGVRPALTAPTGRAGSATGARRRRRARCASGGDRLGHRTGILGLAG